MSLKQSSQQSGDEAAAKRCDVSTTPSTKEALSVNAAIIATVSVVASEKLASVCMPPRCPSKAQREQEYLSIFLEEKINRRRRQKRRRYN
ncbi:MAG: hypothetical protein ACX932_00555 [Gammaproteobacteria bacterium]